jgi:hypothetical protein
MAIDGTKHKTEATVLANCIKEISSMEGDKLAKQRLLRTLAAHFELDTPSFRPPRPPWGRGGMQVRYGTPFP